MESPGSAVVWAVVQGSLAFPAEKLFCPICSVASWRVVYQGSEKRVSKSLVGAAGVLRGSWLYSKMFPLGEGQLLPYHLSQEMTWFPCLNLPFSLSSTFRVPRATWVSQESLDRRVDR